MLTKKLIREALALSIAEGWKPRETRDGDVNPSASYKNHNPGNLRVSEYEISNFNGFSIFDNDITGFYALVRQLELAARGEGDLYPAGITAELMFAIYTGLEIGSNELDDYLDIICSLGGFHKTPPASKIPE